MIVFIDWIYMVQTSCIPIYFSTTHYTLPRKFPFSGQCERLSRRLVAYKTLVQPYFDYCSQVWGGLGSTLSDKLQRLQNRAARIITKCGYDVRSCILLQHLNLDNLETRRNQQLATLMFKVRNSMVPRSISNLFQRTDDVHNYETRQVQNYFPPKPNTNLKKKSFSYRGAVACNSLPCDPKTSQTIQCFKNKL
jgi:hypothetical protein